jgi:hypothetical protein
MRRASRTVARVPPFRNDALKPEFAGVMEYDRAVVVEVLVEPQARRRAREHRSQSRQGEHHAGRVLVLLAPGDSR